MQLNSIGEKTYGILRNGAEQNLWNKPPPSPQPKESGHLLRILSNSGRIFRPFLVPTKSQSKVTGKYLLTVSVTGMSLVMFRFSPIATE